MHRKTEKNKKNKKKHNARNETETWESKCSNRALKMEKSVIHILNAIYDDHDDVHDDGSGSDGDVFIRSNID